MAPFTLPLQEALNLSIPSGRFPDTKIILYSWRDSSGTISKPKALYANSHLLKSVLYFSNCESPFPQVQTMENNPHEVLSGMFVESELKDFSEPVDDNEHAENYGYHPNSGLDDNEDTINAGKTKSAAISSKRTANPLLFPSRDKVPAPVCWE